MAAAGHRLCTVSVPSLMPQSFLLRRLTGADEAVLEPNRPGGATRLLARLLAAPDGAGVDPAALPAPVHDRLLAEVFRAEIGETTDCRATCVACSEPFEFRLAPSDLMAAQDAEAAGIGRPAEDGRWPVKVGGTDIRLRPPLLADAQAGDPQALLEAIADPAPTPDDRPALVEFLERAAPLLAVDLASRCPQCGVSQSLSFDLPRFLIRALANDRPFLIREVHLIAARYGWSHAEIMALPRDDRRAFAALIETERSVMLRQRAVG